MAKKQIPVTPATAEAEVNIKENKPEARGRRIVTAQRWAEILAAYPQSGLTQSAFARQEAVNYHTLVARLGRLRLNPLMAPVSPRSCAGAQAPNNQGIGGQRFIEAGAPSLIKHLSLGGSLALPLEVVLPTGILVRGVDPQAIAALVQALGGGTFTAEKN